MILHNSPNGLVIDRRIPMHQDIPERDNPRQIWNAARQIEIEPRKLVQRFADDLELALDGRAQESVTRVIRKCLSARELGNGIRSATRIP